MLTVVHSTGTVSFEPICWDNQFAFEGDAIGGDTEELFCVLDGHEKAPYFFVSVNSV